MFKIVGCIPDVWSDEIDGGFSTEEDAEAEIKRIESGVSGFDYEEFDKNGGSMWVEIDD